MKKFTFIGAIAFAIGIIIFTCSMSALNWDFTKLSTTTEYTKVDYVTQNGDLDIVIVEENIDIIIKKSDSQSDEILVEYNERDGEKYRIIEGENLEIIKDYEFKFENNLFRIDLYSADLIITLPQDYDGKILVNNSNADIKVEEIFANSLELTTSNSEITLENVTVNEHFYTKTSNGDIELKNVALGGNLVAYTSNSDIELENVTTAQAFELTTSNGEVTMEEVTANVGGSVVTTNGDIKVEMVDFGEKLTLKTTHSDVYGTIVGEKHDFDIKSSTTFGDNNLSNSENPSASKVLEVNTTTADIKIDFRKRDA